MYCVHTSEIFVGIEFEFISFIDLLFTTKENFGSMCSTHEYSCVQNTACTHVYTVYTHVYTCVCIHVCCVHSVYTNTCVLMCTKGTTLHKTITRGQRNMTFGEQIYFSLECLTNNKFNKKYNNFFWSL